MYKVNLLPDELTKPGFNLKRITQMSLVSLLVSFMLAVYGVFLYQSHQVKTELARLQNKVASVQPDLKRLEFLRKQRADLEKSASDLEGIAEKRVTWSPVISEINSNMPTDVWLNGLQFYYDNGGAPASETDPQKNQQQGIKPPKTEEVARQSPPAVMPLPNAVSIQGESRSVLPVGVYVNRLLQVKYFTGVRINEVHENQERGTLVFSITALIRGGER